jgi:hypothetical protein
MNDLLRAFRAPIHFTIRGWAIAFLVVMFAVAVGVGVTLYGHQEHKLVAEVSARQEAGRLDRLTNDYQQCVKSNATLDVLRNVVKTAYTGTVSVTPAQIAKLPARTRQLLADLEPLLHVSSHSTTITKAAVLATIPNDENCVVPPGLEVAPTTTLRLPTSTTFAP